MPNKEIQQVLAASFEDYSISRSERKELKVLLAGTQGNKAEQAKVRQLAFHMATEAIERVGETEAMGWLESVIKVLYANEMEVKSRAYFSPGEDCLNRIRQMIGEAQKTLEICVFTITDNRIVRKLEDAIGRGVTIRVVSDNLKSEDLGSDLDELEKMGIACRYDKTDAHMHHKFAIADGGLLLTGSYNWTRSASTENNENVIVTDHIQLVKPFREEFERMWRKL